MPRDGAFGHALLGDAADWTIEAHLLAHVANLNAGGNWQRGGGKGRRPRPLNAPDPRRPSRRKRSADALKRLRNLGLVTPDTR